jgi:hypothetical protein
MEIGIEKERQAGQSEKDRFRLGGTCQMKTVRQMPVGMQVYKLKEFLVQNGIDPSHIDIEANIDRTLSLTENKKEFARRLGIGYQQFGSRPAKRAARDIRGEIDFRHCQYLQENCEQKCNNNACRAFRKSGCISIIGGDVEPCPPRDVRYQRKARSTGGNCEVEQYCVKEHYRPPQHNSRTGQPIKVSAYCVERHSRQCRRSGY